MKALSVMIKPVSSLCNMNCSYCFYKDEAGNREKENLGTMTQSKADILIERLCNYLSDSDTLDLGFQGGEPTLAGIEFYRHFLERLTDKCKAKINFYFQTNGLLIDENYCSLLKNYNVLCGLSLDMNKAFNDKYRKTVSGMGTWSHILATKKLFDKTGVDYNIMSVLTEEMALNPNLVWNFIKSNNLSFVQFIPCLGKLDDSSKGLSPKLFYEFYRTLFDLWLTELKNGTYYSIKFFDDIVHLLKDKTVYSCGLNGKCQEQIIVESDGSTYPCDFYCLDNFKTGNIFTDNIDNILTKTKIFGNKINEPDEVCKTCKYKILCNGNCPRQRYNMCIENNICYYAKLLDYIIGLI